MKADKYIFSTLKKNKNNKKILSYELMLRAGMLRKLSSGLYTWLPTGFKILYKLENFIRKEMIKFGSIEILMPMIQSANLWLKSGRYSQYGSELLKILDRNNKKFILAPTYEEIITFFIKNELKSYKKLPINFFQISNKFRDEIRPSYGIIRSKEFIMKDAYSFHENNESLESTYNDMLILYKKIFDKIKLKYFIAKAKTGKVGGNISHEFHAINDFKINNINKSNIFKKKSVIKFNIKKNIKIFYIHGINNLDDLFIKTNIEKNKFLKIIVVKSSKLLNYTWIGLMLRSNEKLNKNKLDFIPQIFKPLTIISDEKVKSKLGIYIHELGPINSRIPIFMDIDLVDETNFIIGANFSNAYFYNVNWERDLKIPPILDFKQEKIKILNYKNKNINNKKGIEIAHIFQLGKKYSSVENLYIKNRCGINKKIHMGCYGIGLNRVIAALIEQNNDKYGIILPDILAPFNIAIIPIDIYKNSKINKISENIYNNFLSLNIDTILDNREKSLGFKLRDMYLIGIPHIIIVSHKNLDNNCVEYISRQTNINRYIKINNISKFLLKRINI